MEHLINLIKNLDEHQLYDIVYDLNERNSESTPNNKKRHLGIELEFYSKTRRRDLLFDLFTKTSLCNKINLGGDCSIRTPDMETGYELRLLTTEKDYEKDLKELCKALKKNKCKVNISCGLHVHIDCRYRDSDIVFNNLIKAQNLLYSLVKHDRIENQYSCIQEVENPTICSDHSWGVEKSVFDTVEARLHHGTLDYSEIVNWIKILTKIANKKTEYKKYKTYKTIINNTNFNKITKEYITNTIKKMECDNVQRIIKDAYSPSLCYSDNSCDDNYMDDLR